MPSLEEYAKQPTAQRLERLTRTAEQLAAAIEGQSDAALSRRPDGKNWAAKEVVCHLRDTEESFGARFAQILAMDTDPRMIGADADRVAEERQYLRNDAGEALGAFRKRREETLATLRSLAHRSAGPASGSAGSSMARMSAKRRPNISSASRR